MNIQADMLWNLSKRRDSKKTKYKIEFKTRIKGINSNVETTCYKLNIRVLPKFLLKP